MTWINATVGLINGTVNDINGTVGLINGTVNLINETVNLINGNVTWINGTVTEINTTVGIMNVTVNNIWTEIQNIEAKLDANSINTDGTFSLYLSNSFTDIFQNFAYMNLTFNTLNNAINSIADNLTTGGAFFNFVDLWFTNTNANISSVNSTVLLVNQSIIDALDNLNVTQMSFGSGNYTVDSGTGYTINTNASYAKVTLTLTGYGISGNNLQIWPGLGDKFIRIDGTTIDGNNEVVTIEFVATSSFTLRMSAGSANIACIYSIEYAP